MFWLLALRILQQGDDDADIVEGQDHRFLIMGEQSVQKFLPLRGLTAPLQNVIVEGFNFIPVGGEDKWLLVVLVVVWG